MIRNGIGSPVPFLSPRNAGDCLLGGLGIFALCMIGQEFYKVSGTIAAPLWPSSGLALALLLLGGWRLFPAITFGTIAATQAFGDSLIFSLAGSLANTLESLIGWFLMVRVFDFSNSMTRVRDSIVLMLAGAPWGTMVSAILCTLGLVAAGAVKPGGIPLSSLLFWTGNVLGILVFTPLTLRISSLCLERTPKVFRWNDLLATVGLGLVIIGGFGLRKTAHTGYIALAYVSFPLMVWLSLEWRRNVTFAIGGVTVLMTAFTVTGHGPLLRSNPLATYAEMSIFMAVYSISCLVIMGAVEETAQLTELAVTSRIAAARREIELRGIRSTLNPHFLFNSLNVIKSLISENPESARKAVLSLSDILRTSLSNTDHEVIPLGEELAVIRAYLELQSLRMEELLAVSYAIGEGLESIQVPPMLFHQMVENAIKHSSPGKISLRISAISEGGNLLLSVTNPGYFDDRNSLGIGLTVIRSQLQAIYGSDASFRIVNQPCEVESILTIPLAHR